MSKSREAAEIMFANGGWFTAYTLGKAMGLPSQKASGFLWNIRNSPMYQTEETPLPGRKIKLIAINGRKRTEKSLWNLALFGGKKA